MKNQPPNSQHLNDGSETKLAPAKDLRNRLLERLYTNSQALTYVGLLMLILALATFALRILGAAPTWMYVTLIVLWPIGTVIILARKSIFRGLKDVSDGIRELMKT